MSTFVIGRADASRIFIRRSITQSRRDVETLVTSIALPAILMVMFTVLFGGALGPAGGYANYVVPGIMLLAASFGASSTAVSVARDMREGMVDRLRTMLVPRGTIIFGHVIASTARNLVAMVVVVGVGLVCGFRPSASVAEWLAAAALIVLFVVAMTYVFAALGMLAGSPEAASGYGFALLFLPYLSSAFVPVDTMPSWLQGVAQHQPMTPIVDTVRALLVGGTGRPVAAVAWGVGLALFAAAWATWLFARKSRS